MRPNGFSADQRNAHRAAACTSPTAATKVSAEIAPLTTSRARSERVFCRNGKKRSNKNSSSARTTIAIIGASCFTSVCTGRSGHCQPQLTAVLNFGDYLILMNPRQLNERPNFEQYLAGIGQKHITMKTTN